jgi:hypothetical protein
MEVEYATDGKGARTFKFKLSLPAWLAALLF